METQILYLQELKKITMKLTNEFTPIRDWAKSKGIYEKGDSKTQCIKLMEEMGELSQSLLKKDIKETKDAIGDCVVVLTSLARLCGLQIEDCINSAYDEIKNREGIMDNGTFKKNTYD